MAKIFFYVFICSFLISRVLIFIFKTLSQRKNFLIQKGIPLVGGIAMVVSFIVSSVLGLSLFRDFSPVVTGIILASFLMMLFGVIDDWKELSVFWKFIVQIIATSLLIIFGVRTQIIYIGNFANILVTFIWVIGITNAFNHLDILDGLCGGLGLIISLSFFSVALFNFEINVAILALALTGALLGFLIYNFPPAKVYMGNAGSHFLGFILAAIAIMISYAPVERKLALFTPVLILGLPIFDTAFLIFVRWRKKKPIFKKSSDHLTLRFLKSKHPQKKTLLYIYALGVFFCLAGLLLSQLPNRLSWLILVSVIFVALFTAIKMLKVSNV